ncbi:DUF6463 family protein [Nocardia asteroides]|uniref:DUF6463 family protein n=1 Tax=Nocardia asteroides TaxID=1824 RepID=UPI0037AB4079
MYSKTRFPLVGAVLFAIFTAHTVLGIVLLLRNDQDVEISFWFTAGGVIALALAVAVMELERALGYVPISVSVALGIVMVVGLIYIPVSGFGTLLVPLALGIVGWRRHRAAAATPA